MKRTALLLTTTALLLSACDDNKTSDIGWLDALTAFVTGKVPQEYLMDDLSVSSSDILNHENYIEKTTTGSYLAGRFAQSNFDWETASTFYKDVLASDPENADLQKRSMALAMGAGDYPLALELARKISLSDNQNSLPTVFLAMEDLKAQNYKKVLAGINKIPSDGISEFIKPLLAAWASAGEKKLNISELNKNVVHFYHAILIADYLNDANALKTLSLRDYSQLGLSYKTLNQIASIFQKHGLKAQADEIQKLVPAGIRDESGGDISQISSPIEGMSRALFDLSSVLYQDYPDSARLFAQMSLYLDPSAMDTRILMGQMASEFERFDEAIAIYNNIDTKNNLGLAIKVKRQIADLLTQAGKKDQAIAILEELVDQTKSVDAQIQIGDIYRDKEDYAEALKQYNKAYKFLDGKVTPRYWNLLYARGICHERLKNWDLAEKDLKAALALEPDQPYILNYLGYSWIDQGLNMEEATHMIEKAVRLRPEDGYIVDSLGWAYYKQNKFQQAVTSLEKAIELSPYDPTINDHLGDAYWQVGRKNEATFQWKRALNLDPDAEQKASLEKKIEYGLDAETSAASDAAAQIKDSLSTTQ